MNSLMGNSHNYFMKKKKKKEAVEMCREMHALSYIHTNPKKYFTNY